MFRGKAQRVHFVGIGGVGMNGIAELLLNLDFEISGSDLKSSTLTLRLSRLGATVAKGHRAENIGNADVVVVSSAVKPDNPEVQAARERGIPVIRRAEMLAELMRLKYGVAVAGMHGKTTTTSLIGTVLAEGGIDPTIVIGGRLKSIKANARLGMGEYLVAEADESDGSFLNLIPTIAVITNIDPEHLDYWVGGMPQIVDAFVDFANKIPFYGCSVLCLDHPTVQGLLPRLEKRFLTYGLSPQADYSASHVVTEPGKTTFRVKKGEKILGSICLKLIGHHNVQNGLAAIAVADEIGVPFESIALALENFEGIARRFETKGRCGDIEVVDDYAHHPAEIKTTIEAAREAYDRRLVVAFQPHRYSRTRDLMADFASAFNGSDVLLVSDVYPAGEDPIDGIDAQALVRSIGACGHHDVRAIGDLDDMIDALVNEVRDGDLVITLGAGDIGRVGDDFLDILRANLPQPEALSHCRGKS